MIRFIAIKDYRSPLRREEIDKVIDQNSTDFRIVNPLFILNGKKLKLERKKDNDFYLLKRVIQYQNPFQPIFKLQVLDDNSLGCKVKMSIGPNYFSVIFGLLWIGISLYALKTSHNEDYAKLALIFLITFVSAFSLFFVLEYFLSKKLFEKLLQLKEQF